MQLFSAHFEFDMIFATSRRLIIAVCYVSGSDSGR